MSDTTLRECLLCATEDADDASIVFRDELWAAEVVEGMEVPGWFVLRSRRHAETITGLDDAELGSLARRTRDLVAAVSEITAAPATYLMVFGENHPHFHILVTARTDNVPADRRSGNILKLLAEQSDSSASRLLVPAVGKAYGRYANSDRLIPFSR